MSSFFFYIGEQVPKHKAEHPDLTHLQATSEVSTKWNALDEEEKAPYVKMNEQAKVRYLYCA